MEQVYNGMLAMMQVMAGQQGFRNPVGQKETAEGSDFQTLLEQGVRANKDGGTAKQNPTSEMEGEKKPALQDDKDPSQLGSDDLLTQERMSLAALSVMQVPVTVVQQPQEAPVLEPVAPVAPALAPVSEETVSMPVSSAIQTEAFTGDAGMEGAMEVQPPLEAEQAVARPVANQVQVKVEEETRPMNRGEAAPEKGTADQEDGIYASIPEQTVFGEVEAVPVKVGEVSRPEGSDQLQDVGAQLAKGLTEVLEQGDSKLELRLTPEYLGTVKIELTRHENGTLQVVLTAESTQTRGLLERHASNLQTLLSGRGQEAVRVEVQKGQESRQHTPNYDGRGGEQGSSRQQEQRQQRQTHSGQDFLQQLRLGLIPMEEAAS